MYCKPLKRRKLLELRWKMLWESDIEQLSGHARRGVLILVDTTEL